MANDSSDSLKDKKLQIFRSNDEIDVKAIFMILKAEIITIGFITVIAAIISVFFALSLPNTYSADALLAPNNNEQPINKMQSLTSLVGIKAPNAIDETTRALEILKSRNFINQFVKRYEIAPYLFAMESWDFAKKKPIFDIDIYDPDTKTWTRDTKEGNSSTPNDFEVHKKFGDILSIDQDHETNFVKISIESVSPEYAHQWLKLLIQDLNKYVRDSKVEELNRSISYLEVKAAQTKLVGIRDIFYTLIQENIQSKLLAETREEYAFQTIDPALIPQKKSGPARALICILGTFIGGFIGIIIAFIRYYRR